MGKRNQYQSIVIIVVILTAVTLIMFISKVICNGYGFWISGLDVEASGQAGDFIGGVIGTVFSAGAFVWAYLTLLEQKRSQTEEQLESRFFELLALHRQNVDEMVFDASGRIFDPDTICVSNRVHHGKAVFREVFKQITSCRNEIAPFFKKENEIYENEYLETLKNNHFLRDNRVHDYVLLALIDISYCIVFFGVGAEGKRVLLSLFDNKYKKDFIERIIEYISLKPAEDEEKYKRWHYIEERKVLYRRLEIARAITLSRNNQPYNGKSLLPEDDKYIRGFDSHFVKYYGGHQFRLGHYFRHLFQTVRYINERDGLDYPTRYGYIKLLRAQLSNYEQAILFFNSLSQVGRRWEMDAIVNPNCKGYLIEDFELITKYNLIKNIPVGALLKMEPSSFYSQVEYEYSPYNIDRKKYS